MHHRWNWNRPAGLAKDDAVREFDFVRKAPELGEIGVPPPEPVTLNVLAEGLLAQLTSALKLPMTCVASATWPLVIWLGIAH
jgi:hypothetical protein